VLVKLPAETGLDILIGSAVYPYLSIDSGRLRMLRALAERLGLADLPTIGIAQRECMADSFTKHIVSRIDGNTLQLTAIVLQVLRPPILDVPLDQVNEAPGKCLAIPVIALRLAKTSLLLITSAYLS
jgi:hypothetical protein